MSAGNEYQTGEEVATGKFYCATCRTARPVADKVRLRFTNTTRIVCRSCYNKRKRRI